MARAEGAYGGQLAQPDEDVLENFGMLRRQLEGRDELLQDDVPDVDEGVGKGLHRSAHSLEGGLHLLVGNLLRRTARLPEGRLVGSDGLGGPEERQDHALDPSLEPEGLEGRRSHLVGHRGEDSFEIGEDVGEVPHFALGVEDRDPHLPVGLDALIGEGREDRDPFFDVLAEGLQGGTGLRRQRDGELLDGRVGEGIRLHENIGHPGKVLHVLRGIGRLQSEGRLGIGREVRCRRHIEHPRLRVGRDRPESRDGLLGREAGRGKVEVGVCRLRRPEVKLDPDPASFGRHPIPHHVGDVAHDRERLRHRPLELPRLVDHLLEGEGSDEGSPEIPDELRGIAGGLPDLA